MTVSSGHLAAPAQGYVRVAEDSAEPQFRVWADLTVGAPAAWCSPYMWRTDHRSCAASRSMRRTISSATVAGYLGSHRDLMVRKINNCLGVVTGHASDTAADLRLRTWSG